MRRSPHAAWDSGSPTTAASASPDSFETKVATTPNRAPIKDSPRKRRRTAGTKAATNRISAETGSSTTAKWTMRGVHGKIAHAGEDAGFKRSLDLHAAIVGQWHLMIGPQGIVQWELTANSDISGNAFLNAISNGVWVNSGYRIRDGFLPVRVGTGPTTRCATHSHDCVRPPRPCAAAHFAPRRSASEFPVAVLSGTRSSVSHPDQDLSEAPTGLIVGKGCSGVGQLKTAVDGHRQLSRCHL